MARIPEIQTPRLRLRGHREADHDPAFRLWQEPEVYERIGGRPLSSQEVWMRLLRYSGLWDLLGYGYWAVEDRASGHYLGQLGFADFRRGLTGFDGRYPEAGWMIAPEWSGQGVATEAMRAACAWLDRQPAWERSFCLVDDSNPASQRVAAKLGYCYVLDTRLGDGHTGVYFRSRGGGIA
jgi:RimJ/RimL family protein N-acetyltransferase